MHNHYLSIYISKSVCVAGHGMLTLCGFMTQYIHPWYFKFKTSDDATAEVLKNLGYRISSRPTIFILG